MKTQKNTEYKDVEVYRYKAEKIEKAIYSKHREILETIAKGGGRDHGMRNKPEPECESANAYCGEISSGYQRMASSTKTDLQADLEPSHLHSDQIKTEKQIRAIDGKLGETRQEVRKAKCTLDEMDDSGGKKESRFKKIRWFLAFLVITDSLINGSSFMAMGFNFISAILMGLAIGVSVFFIAEHTRELVNKGRTISQRRMIAIGVFLFLYIVFYCLGLIRLLSGDMGNFGIGSSPFIFASLNMFFALSAILVVWFTKPTPQEKKDIDIYETAQENLIALEKRADDLVQKIVKLEDKQANRELSRKQLMQYARDLQYLISTLYEESMKAFMSQNLATRNDGKVPEFFNKPIAPLTTLYAPMDIINLKQA